MKLTEKILKEATVLTREQFYQKYVAMHMDLKGHDGEHDPTEVYSSISQDGFQSSGGLNAIPIWKGGKPRNVVESKYAPRAGEYAYILTRKWVKPFGPYEGDGYVVKSGYRPAPDEFFKIEYDFQDTYEAYLHNKQLTEWNVQQKDSIGSGKEHHTFDMKTMPGYVVKQKHYKEEQPDDENYNGIGMLGLAAETAPELVAHIAKKGNNWAVVEKLDTSRVQRENELLEEATNHSNSLFGTIYDYIVEDMPRKIQELRQKVINYDEGLVPVFDKYVEFISKVAANFEEFYPDLYWANIGYDKQGNLKLLDI